MSTTTTILKYAQPDEKPLKRSILLPPPRITIAEDLSSTSSDSNHDLQSENNNSTTVVTVIPINTSINNVSPPPASTPTPTPTPALKGSSSGLPTTSPTTTEKPGDVLEETTFKFGGSSTHAFMRKSQSNVPNSLKLSSHVMASDHIVLSASSDYKRAPPSLRTSIGAIAMMPISQLDDDDTAHMLGDEELEMDDVELYAIDQASNEPLTIKERILARIGLVFMVLSAFLFSIMGLLVKLATKRLGSFQVAFIRSVYGLVGCLIILGTMRVSPLGDKSKRLFLTVRGLSGTVSLACYFLTLSTLPLSEAVCVSFTSPVITAALAAVILKEKWGPIEGVCAVLSLTGVAVIAKPEFIFGSPTDSNLGGHLRLIYILIGILGSVFAGISFVAVRKIGPGTNPFVLVCYFSLVSSVVLLPMSFIFQSFVAPNLKEWGLLTALGIVALLAQVSINRGMQLEKAGKAASMNYTQIIFTFIWELLFLHEKLDLFTMLGAGLILSCAAITAFRK
eukprot:gene16156-19226_t